jgi:regulator of sigma E protease
MMELIAGIPLIGGFLATVLPFLLVLGVVVFVHEYGHYIVGRWCGIHAEAFSLGFGPVLTSWHDKRGTKWQIAAIPLGGYVKFLGDKDGASQADTARLQTMEPADYDRSFQGARLYKRSLTVFAGPAANFVLSTVIFAGIAMVSGVATDEPIVGEMRPLPGAATELRQGDKIEQINGTDVATYTDVYRIGKDLPAGAPVIYTVVRDGVVREVSGPYLAPALIAEIQPLSASSEAGLQKGDVILAIAGQEVGSFYDLIDIIQTVEEVELPLRIWRNGEILDLTITPKQQVAENSDGEMEQRVMIGAYGAAPFGPQINTPAPWTAAWMGVNQTGAIIGGSLKIITNIVNGNISAKNLQGPVGIAQVSGESAARGFSYLIWLVAVVSTSIGFLNLLPIPVLDGGHLLMFGYEAVSGRTPNEKFMQVVMTIGLSFLLLLMVFATYNDIMRL